MTQAARNRAAGEFSEARRACTAHFLFATAFTVLINVLAFTYPIFMIQVYDRVISSRSVETLIALLAGVTLALLFRAMFEWTRSQLLIRAAVRIDNRLSERVFSALIERSGSLRRDTGSQALRDLDTVKRYTTGRGALAVMDAPWVGLFVGVMFLMDAVIGYTALACISIMIVLILLNAIITKKANIRGGTGDQPVLSVCRGESEKRGRDPRHGNDAGRGRPLEDLAGPGTARPGQRQ